MTYNRETSYRHLAKLRRATWIGDLFTATVIVVMGIALWFVPDQAAAAQVIMLQAFAFIAGLGLHQLNATVANDYQRQLHDLDREGRMR